jgi:hypothetical protein
MGLSYPTQMRKMRTAEANRRQFPHFKGLNSDLAELHLEVQGVTANDRILHLDFCCWLLVNE